MNAKILLLLNLLWLPLAGLRAQAPDPELLRSTLEAYFNAKNPHPDLWWAHADPARVRYEPGIGLLVSTPVFRSSPITLTESRQGGRVTVVTRNGDQMPGTNPDLIQELLTGWVLAYGVQARDLPPQEKLVISYAIQSGQDTKGALAPAAPGRLDQMGQSYSFSFSQAPLTAQDSLRVRELVLEVPISALRDFKGGKLSESDLRKQIRRVRVRTLGDAAEETPLEEQVFIAMLEKLAVSAAEPAGLMTWTPAGARAAVGREYTPGVGYAFEIGSEGPMYRIDRGRMHTGGYRTAPAVIWRDGVISLAPEAPGDDELEEEPLAESPMDEEPMSEEIVEERIYLDAQGRERREIRKEVRKGARGERIYRIEIDEDEREAAAPDDGEEEAGDEEADEEEETAAEPEADESETVSWEAFKLRLANAMLDYGPTLKQLGTGERLSILVRRPAAAGSGWPEQITASISQQDLMQWDKRAISREQALARIQWRE
ncbi:MAG: hypothetical protein NW241_19880 [Bacteroidia bacterium]|nr:hypothetical protein [Bacteroidia bacterium]